jgi:hypothetical protein
MKVSNARGEKSQEGESIESGWHMNNKRRKQQQAGDGKKWEEALPHTNLCSW